MDRVLHREKAAERPMPQSEVHKESLSGCQADENLCEQRAAATRT